MTDTHVSPRPLLYTPEAVAESLGIGRTMTYELMSTGKIESVKVGRCRRIPAAALDEYVNRLRQESRGDMP